MRYPQFLKDRGTIGFVAPSFGAAIEPYSTCFESAKNKFKEMGYKLIEGPNCKRSDGIGISASPKECGDELTKMYKNPSVDVLISVGGGEMMCEDLPHIDFEALKKSTPKWYMGYSDNTNFVFTSATIADTAAIYGPCVSSFGMEEWHESIQDTWNLLTGKSLSVHNYDTWEVDQIKDDLHPLVGYNLTEPFVMKKFPNQDITFSGRLLGGCMDCLQVLLGTPFDQVKPFNERYKEDGVIWFLEACDFNLFSIRRALWQMKQAGWFECAKGFLIGRPYNYGSSYMGLDQYKAVMDMLADLKVPILMDLDIGHRPPMMPLICGAYATATAKENTFSLQFDLK